MAKYLNKSLTMVFLICVVVSEASHFLSTQSPLCALSYDQRRIFGICIVYNSPAIVQNAFMECTPDEDDKERLDIIIEEFSIGCTNPSLDARVKEFDECLREKRLPQQEKEESRGESGEGSDNSDVRNMIQKCLEMAKRRS